MIGHERWWQGENRLYVEMLTSRKENGGDIGIDVSGGGKRGKGEVRNGRSE